LGKTAQGVEEFRKLFTADDADYMIS